MSHGHIAVSPEQIQHAASEVRRTANNVRRELDDLEKGVKRIAESWSGSAKEGYHARQQEWDKRANSLHHTLEAIAKALDTAADNYRQTEDRNAKIW
ncbi:WXG100 family type VII secretion target [Streptomyces sp. NPDC002067]